MTGEDGMLIEITLSSKNDMLIEITLAGED
jgi:hypothetical protein